MSVLSNCMNNITIIIAVATGVGHGVLNNNSTRLYAIQLSVHMKCVQGVVSYTARSLRCIFVLSSPLHMYVYIYIYITVKKEEYKMVYLMA